MTNDLTTNPTKQEGEANTGITAASAAATHNTTGAGRERDEKEESSTSTSTESDGGKGNSSGSGSGSGGYNADYSSSDSSLNNDPATRIPEKQMTMLNISSGAKAGEDNGVGIQSAVSNNRVNTSSSSSSSSISTGAKDIAGTPTASSSKASSKAMGQLSSGEEIGTQQSDNSSHDNNNNNNDFSKILTEQHRHIIDSAVEELNSCLPQWNGVKIEHPMDPRIDLSTVGFSIGSVHLTPFVPNISINNYINSNAESGNKVGTNQNIAPNHQVQQQLPFANTDVASIENNNTNNGSSAVPSVDQYYKLLESVRPFFCAHGITTQEQETANSIQRSEESESVEEKASSESNAAVGDLIDTAKTELAAVCDLIDTAKTELAAGDILDPAKSELAAAYARAAAASAPQEDEENDKDSSSMVVLVRPKRKHSTKQEGTDSNSVRSASSSEEEARVQQQQQQQHPQMQQAANHEDVAVNENNGNDQAIMEEVRQQPQEQQNLLGAAQRYGIPAIVSEYSSSARNESSGASNINLSGSGSGGNTASGTGSGSNQGGSSGSGNDQGGISSNGNGSSGSGNDAKGSSEEMMDHNGETNNGENRAVSSPSNTKNKIDVQDMMNAFRFSPNPSEPSAQHRLSSQSHDCQDQNAAREKKLQDKKRKRMNMRRVYEDQMEQDMGSSDSSSEPGVLRPGKPVTIDNAISFTKTAKLVIKASPSFTVIHTNAAYSRLSGIDSHNAVGNSITSLLSLPSQQLDYQKDDPSPDNSTLKVTETENFDRMNDADNDTTDSKIHAAAEAAGRARAAAGHDDNTVDGLEKLVVASGYSKLNRVNIRCKPHKMIGRNVKVFKSIVPMKKNQEEGSNGSSITSSYDGPYNLIACTMSISPVVSSPEIYNNVAMANKEKKGEHHHNKAKRNEKDHDSHQQKSKRRKHHHAMHEIIHGRKRQVVSHYVIQLEPHEGDSTEKGTEMGSQSSLSTDVEARKLGLTKDEVRQQRVIPTTVNASNQNAKGEKESEVSESQIEVSAVA